MIATDHGTALTEYDYRIIEHVPLAIAQGRDLRQWWQRAQKTPEVLGRFPVCRQIHTLRDWNYGFITNAFLREGSLPVAGVMQDQLFDFPKAPAGMAGRDPNWVRGQVREFMMRHFMRLTYAGMPSPPPQTLAPFGRPGQGGSQSYGWGYQQWYYKLAGSGEIGKFPDSQRYQIIDLREIGPKYSWVVFKVDIFGFDFTIPPVPTGPQLSLPLPQRVYTVCTPDFVVHEEDPEPGVLGDYGYGYSVVPHPDSKTLFAAGPSKITHTIETLHLRVLDTGEVRARMEFITPQPQQIMEFKPVTWSFDIADFFTFGAASTLLAPVKRILEGFEPQIDPVYTAVRLLDLLTLGVSANDYCVTKEQLFKLLMVLHFIDVFHMYNTAASYFCMVPDWTAEKSLPGWARQGTFTSITNPHF